MTRDSILLTGAIELIKNELYGKFTIDSIIQDYRINNFEFFLDYSGVIAEITDFDSLGIARSIKKDSFKLISQKVKVLDDLSNQSLIQILKFNAPIEAIEIDSKKYVLLKSIPQYQNHILENGNISFDCACHLIESRLSTKDLLIDMQIVDQYFENSKFSDLKDRIDSNENEQLKKVIGALLKILKDRRINQTLVHSLFDEILDSDANLGRTTVVPIFTEANRAVKKYIKK